MEKKTVLSVRLLRAARATDRVYDYLVPDGLSPARGDLVKIPFGKGDRVAYGIALGTETKTPDRELKTVLGVFGPELAGEMN